jgi:hypothetical protein
VPRERGRTLLPVEGFQTGRHEANSGLNHSFSDERGLRKNVKKMTDGTMPDLSCDLARLALSFDLQEKSMRSVVLSSL